MLVFKQLIAQDAVASIRAGIEALCDAGRQVRTEDFDLSGLPAMYQIPELQPMLRNRFIVEMDDFIEGCHRVRFAFDQHFPVGAANDLIELHTNSP